jgi:tetratricopeptide (TPR) repeat protein
MRSLTPISLTICFVSALLVFSATIPLCAQDTKSSSEFQELRKQNEALKRQIQDLRRTLQELKGQLRQADTFGASTSEMAPPSSSNVATSSLASHQNHRLELEKKVLESALLSHGDVGLVALLRFEKANACREAGMLDKAAEELRKIIVLNLTEEVTNAARWTLVEVLQEQKQREQAIAELEKILAAANRTPEKKREAIYGIIGLSGNDLESRIRRIDSLIDRLIADSVAARAKTVEVEGPNIISKFAIPEENLQIFEEMKACAANLRKIHAAIKRYEMDKGKLPDWLSDLVPDYLRREELFCPDDPDWTTIWYPDPKLPCSYSYEFSPAKAGTQYTGGRDISCREWKTQQLKFFGNVVPVVRCVHHSPELNISWDGQVYMSGMRWEEDLMPGYYRGVEFDDLPPDLPEAVKEETQRQLDKVLEVCRKYSAQEDREAGTLQSEAIREISSFGSTEDEHGRLQTQITIGNEEQILYHIVRGHIGGDTSRFMRTFADGKPLDKKSGAFLRLAPGRNTLWRHDYFPERGWYIMVEGHWYD